MPTEAIASEFRFASTRYLGRHLRGDREPQGRIHELHRYGVVAHRLNRNLKTTLDLGTFVVERGDLRSGKDIHQAIAFGSLELRIEDETIEHVAQRDPDDPILTAGQKIHAAFGIDIVGKVQSSRVPES